MNPPNNPQRNLHEKATGDIEAGHKALPAVSVSPTGAADYAKGVFNQIYQTINEKRYPHVDFKKRAVYERLMNQLDDVEERDPKFTFSLISVEFLVLSGLTAALACTLTLEKMKYHRFLRLRMWQWVTMVLMIASGLTVVRFATFLVLWPVKRWWRIHKYVVFFVRQLKGCLDVTLWFCIVLLGWYIWFRPRLKHVHGELSVVVTHQVTRFLIALCLGSFLWLLKNVLYLKLEADLHYNHLFDRLQQTVVYLHGIQIIHNRGMWKFLTDNRSKKKLLRMANSENINDEDAATARKEAWIKGVNIWMDVRAMERESAPIWILRRLAEEYLDQLKLHPLPGTSDHIKEDKKILREAKNLFKQLIFKRIRIHDLSDQEVSREDLKEYHLKKMELDVIFKDRNIKEEEEDEEEEDGEIIQPPISSTSHNEDRSIGYDEFLNCAVRAYKNCWGFERTLNSSKSVFVKLNRLLSIFLLTVMLIIWLLLSEIIKTGQLALVFTPFLAATFIFGDSCKKMFEGLIFAFAVHPFDVGDRVIINNAQMRVMELNILTTNFYKYDTGEEVITPNSMLTTTSIINLDITPDQGDKVEFVLNSLTPLEDMKDLEIKIKKLLDEDIEYSSNNKVVKSEIGKEEAKMTVYFKYLLSYLNAEAKALHKSKILSMIMKLQKDMKINNKEYPPSYKPYIVEITLSGRKLKMEHLKLLQSDMMSYLERDSKVVIMKLTKSRIKMGLYVGKEEDVKETEKDKPEPPPKMIVKEINDRDVEKLSEALKRNKFVHYVKILQANEDGIYKVIAQGGKKWESFRATDVIQSEPDHRSITLETIPSGDGETIGRNNGDFVVHGHVISSFEIAESKGN